MRRKSLDIVPDYVMHLNDEDINAREEALDDALRTLFEYGKLDLPPGGKPKLLFYADDIVGRIARSGWRSMKSSDRVDVETSPGSVGTTLSMNGEGTTPYTPDSPWIGSPSPFREKEPGDEGRSGNEGGGLRIHTPPQSVALGMVLSLAMGAVFASCGVSEWPLGCQSAADCAADRVCLDGLCAFPEEADRQLSLDDLGRRLFSALATNDNQRIGDCGLSAADFDYAFIMGADPEQPAHAEAEHRRWLVDDARRRLALPLLGQYVGMVPGRPQPLALGRPELRHATERLVDTTLRWRDGNGEMGEIRIGQIVRVRGRWRVLGFSTPVNPDGPAEDR